MDTLETYEKLNRIANMNLSEFIEKTTNRKLSVCEKEFLDKVANAKYFYSSKMNNKRLIAYYSACSHLSKMKDDEVLVVIRPNGYEKMNKERFADYLMNEYWNNKS